jgi:hypothetical protein
LSARTRSPGIGELAKAVRDRRAILFVGAGVSMSVGLPSWEALIAHMADELGLDRDSIGAPQSSYQMLAEYYLLKQGSMAGLHRWMTRNWRVSRAQVEQSRLHAHIVDLDFPLIYTTNYDRNLEVAYECHGRPYTKVTNARDIAKTSPEVTQIVKFHGDFDDESSLVLAETDYFDRLSFDSPLDVKFRADALGRTILFIGYSVTDMNIRLLLHRLWQTWSRSHAIEDRPPSFVFMPRHNPVQEAVLGRWGITLLSGQREDPQDALGDFLETLQRRVRKRVRKATG